MIISLLKNLNDGIATNEKIENCLNQERLAATTHATTMHG